MLRDLLEKYLLSQRAKNKIKWKKKMSSAIEIKISFKEGFPASTLVAALNLHINVENSSVFHTGHSKLYQYNSYHVILQNYSKI